MNTRMNKVQLMTDTMAIGIKTNNKSVPESQHLKYNFNISFLFF